MSRRFEFSEGNSNKFWEVSVDGETVVTTWGRVGTDGQVTKKVEATPEKAQAAAEKLIRQKTAKGYVEAGARATKQAPPGRVAAAKKTTAGTEPAVAAKKKPAPGKPVTVSLAGAPKYVVPLTGARCVVLDDTQTLTWFDARGQKLGARKVGDSSAPRAGPDGNIAIMAKKQVLVLGPNGKPVRTFDHDCARAIALSDGTVLVLAREGGRLSRLSDKGKPKPVLTLTGTASFLLATSDGFTATTKDGESKAVRTFDLQGKVLGVFPFKGKRHSAPIELAPGKYALAYDDRLLLTPAKTVKLPGLVAAPGVTSGQTIAVPVDGGVVALIDAKGKVLSVRRDAPGAGENQVRITHGPEGTFVLPGLDGTVHHVNAKGEFLGSLKLGAALSQRSEAATLDDGTLVVADGKHRLHFFTVGHFGPATPPVVKDLSGEAKTLAAHFAPWVATPQCKQVLAALLERLVEVKRAGKTLTLGFLTDDSQTFEVTFGPPGKQEPAMPASYNAALALHGSVVLGGGVPDELQFGDCNLEHDVGDRWIGLCDAGQNWLAFDTKTKNKLGEPSIVLVDHGAAIEDATAYPAQKKLAFGVPGHLLRSIAFRVLERDERYGDFSWG